MEWNMEEKFSMEWNMEWKIFSMEWKKIAVMEYGKIIFHFIPYHALIFKRSSKKGLRVRHRIFLEAVWLFQGKGGNRTNTTFLNQISDFPNKSVAQRKMLLWLTDWKPLLYSMQVD